MKFEKPGHEFPIDWQDWRIGAGQPASIWWHEGRTWFAGFDSLAEAKLIEAGAFHVATLQFEPDAQERGCRRGQVRTLSPDVALQWFGI